MKPLPITREMVSELEALTVEARTHWKVSEVVSEPRELRIRELRGKVWRTEPLLALLDHIDELEKEIEHLKEGRRKWMLVSELRQDYDWNHAIMEALAGKDYDLPADAEVIAKEEGENDGAEWVCVCRCSDGTWIYFSAGCDYTGWDCQAGGDAVSAPDLASLMLAMDESGRDRLGEALLAYTQRLSR